MANDAQARIEAVARKTWDGLNASERHGVRFGLFPAVAMAAAEVELTETPHPSNAVALALMKIASEPKGRYASGREAVRRA